MRKKRVLRSNIDVILYDQDTKSPPTTRSAFTDDWASFYGSGEVPCGENYKEC